MIKLKSNNQRRKRNNQPIDTFVENMKRVARFKLLLIVETDPVWRERLQKRDPKFKAQLLELALFKLNKMELVPYPCDISFILDVAYKNLLYLYNDPEKNEERVMRMQDIKEYKDFFRNLKRYDSLYERVSYGAK